MWSPSHLWSFNSFHSSGEVFRKILECICGNLSPFIQIICEIRQLLEGKCLACSNSSSSQRCLMGLGSELCASQSSSSTPGSFNHAFMDLALCTGAQSRWKGKDPSQSAATNLEDCDLLGKGSI